jgi:hypothetical protein
MENQTDQNLNPTQSISPDVQTSPISNPVNPPTSAPKSKFPLALIVGIILFLLVAGSAAGFFVFKPQIEKLVAKPTPSPVVQQPTSTPTPTIDPTANWKTYTSDNSLYPFSFKYPPVLAYASGPIVDLGNYINIALSDQQSNYGNYSLSVEVAGKSISRDWYTAALQELRNTNPSAQKVYFEITPTQIDRQAATTYYSTQNTDPKILPAPGSPLGNSYEAVIYYGDLFYRVSYRFITPEKEKEKATFLNILSTFKFTN